MPNKKPKYSTIELKTKEENFLLLSTKKNIYDLYVGDFDAEECGHKQILNKISTLNKKDILNMHISSYGGNSYLLIEYINILQRTSATINGFLNYGYSAGALLFGACNNRFTYEYSELMYHNYSSNICGKSQEIKSHIINSDKILHKMMQKFYIGLTKAEFQQLKDGKDFWFDIDQIKERNIAELI